MGLRQFDYERQQINIVEHGSDRRGASTVYDITYQAPGQRGVDAYLVVPSGRAQGQLAAAMFMHWLGDANADRGQFLEEAVVLAGNGAGLVSLLPQLDFPFTHKPLGELRDKTSVIEQVLQLRRGLDLLTAREDVDNERLALVGHDYGGMYATLLGAVDRDRVHCEVIIAADATFGNWFEEFFLDLPQDEVAGYHAVFDSVDPIHYIAHGPQGGHLLQYATQDFFIPGNVAVAMLSAASSPAEQLTYDVDHELNLPDVVRDRDAFLARSLHLDH